MKLDDVVFRRWVETTPAVVLAIMVAVWDGEPVTEDELTVAHPYWLDLLRDGLRPGAVNLPRG